MLLHYQQLLALKKQMARGRRLGLSLKGQVRTTIIIKQVWHRDGLKRHKVEIMIPATALADGCDIINII